MLVTPGMLVKDIKPWADALLADLRTTRKEVIDLRRRVDRVERALDALHHPNLFDQPPLPPRPVPVRPEDV
jgi:hypothetical protein